MRGKEGQLLFFLISIQQMTQLLIRHPAWLPKMMDVHNDKLRSSVHEWSNYTDVTFRDDREERLPPVHHDHYVALEHFYLFLYSLVSHKRRSREIKSNSHKDTSSDPWKHKEGSRWIQCSGWNSTMATWTLNFSYLVDVSLSTLCSASSLLSTLYGGILGGTRARRRVSTEAGGSVCSSSGPGPIRRAPWWRWPQDERLPGNRLFCPPSWSLVNNSLRTYI